MSKGKVVVKINGAEYTLKGDGSDGYLFSIANYVDGVLQDILKGNPMHSNTSAAVLTAITIADDLCKASDKLDATQKELDEITTREKIIKNKYESINEQYESLLKNYNEYKTNNSVSSKEVHGIKEEYKKLDEKLSEKLNEIDKLNEELSIKMEKIKTLEKEKNELLRGNDKLKADAMEAHIEAVTLRKEIKDFKEARLAHR